MAEEEYGEAENEAVETGHEFLEETKIPAEISLCSVVGLINPKTIKLLGAIQGREVVVMVDPGATHNFVSIKAVEELQIPVTESASFGVALGNGETVRGSGVCKEVKLKLADGWR